MILVKFPIFLTFLTQLPELPPPKYFEIIKPFQFQCKICFHLKVLATLQDRLRAERSSFCCFFEKPYKLYIFGSLIIPENYFLFKNRQALNVFGKWVGFFTRTCVHRIDSSRNKENKRNNTVFPSWHLGCKTASQIFGKCVCSSFISRGS